MKEFQRKPASPKETVNVCLGHRNNHDVRVTFIREKGDVDMESYRPDAAPLRAEGGIGELHDAPLSLRLFEVLKTGESGVKDLSPVGSMQLPMRRVLSSRPYECNITNEGDVTVKFLQYQKPDEFSQKPEAMRAYYGRDHQGTTGDEVKALVTVQWVQGIGIIVEPVHIGERSFEEEAEYAEKILQNPEKMESLNELFDSVRFSMEELFTTNNDNQETPEILMIHEKDIA